VSDFSKTAGAHPPKVCLFLEEKPMRLGYTILYVEDVRRAVEFYESAFGLERKFVHEAGDFAEMATGATSLAFCSRAMLRAMGKAPQAPNPDAPCFEIALVVEEVPAALARALESGARLLQAPEVMAWGQTVAYVADLDGFTVELCTAMG
jgi:predicted enzyme related to lactoylglutathione lyase